MLRHRPLSCVNKLSGVSKHRLVDAMAKLDSEHAVAVNAMSTTEARVVEEAGRQRSTLFDARKPKSPGRVVVTVDVDELHCPIELEVSGIVEANCCLLAPGCDLWLLVTPFPTHAVPECCMRCTDLREREDEAIF